MNLIFRFLYHTLISHFQAPLENTDTDSTKLRVLPHDIDLNFHLNNGRYLSMMDIGRLRITIRMGLHKIAKKKKWSGVVGGANITYLKSIAPLESFHLKTRIAGIHDGWFFIEQKFIKKNKIAAAALVKVTFTEKGKRVKADKVAHMLGVELSNTPYLEDLFDSEKLFLQYIKSQPH